MNPNETPTPPEGYSNIPRAYLEAGNPLPMDCMFCSLVTKWKPSKQRGQVVRIDPDETVFYATAQPLPCFQKGGDDFEQASEQTAEQRIAELERELKEAWGGRGYAR